MEGTLSKSWAGYKLLGLLSRPLLFLSLERGSPKHQRQAPVVFPVRMRRWRHVGQFWGGLKSLTQLIPQPRAEPTAHKCSNRMHSSRYAPLCLTEHFDSGKHAKTLLVILAIKCIENIGLSVPQNI